MTIDEAREHGATAEVDDLRLPSASAHDFAAAAAIDDETVANRQGFRSRVFLIHGVD